MAARGRKPFEDELRVRERIESLYLSGLRPVAIRDALASAQNAAPLELSVRQIQAYLKRIGRGWARSLAPAVLEQERAELIAAGKDVIRVAAASSARYRSEPQGVGYLNAEVRAIASVARLLGLDAVRRTQGAPTGVPADDVHPLDDLSADEQIVRLRQLADLLEQSA